MRGNGNGLGPFASGRPGRRRRETRSGFRPACRVRRTDSRGRAGLIASCRSPSRRGRRWRCAGEADCADHGPRRPLEMREGMLDTGAHRQLRRVRPRRAPRHRPALRLAAEDAARLADRRQAPLVLGGAPGAVGPDVGGRLAGLDPFRLGIRELCRGTATGVAATICPAIGGSPASVIVGSRRANSPSRASAAIGASRKSPGVCVSGTASPGPNTPKHTRLGRSASGHSACASGSPRIACSASIRNFNTGSNGRRPPLERSRGSGAASSSARKSWKPAGAPGFSSGSPGAERCRSRTSTSRTPTRHLRSSHCRLRRTGSRRHRQRQPDFRRPPPGKNRRARAEWLAGGGAHAGGSARTAFVGHVPIPAKATAIARRPGRSGDRNAGRASRPSTGWRTIRGPAGRPPRGHRCRAREGVAAPPWPPERSRTRRRTGSFGRDSRTPRRADAGARPRKTAWNGPRGTRLPRETRP